MSDILESAKENGVYVVSETRYGNLARMVAVTTNLTDAAKAVMDDGDFWSDFGSDNSRPVVSSDVHVWQKLGRWDDENSNFAQSRFEMHQGYMTWLWLEQDTRYVVQWTELKV